VSDDTDDLGPGRDCDPTVDARAARGVQVGDHNTQFSGHGDTVIQTGQVHTLNLHGRRAGWHILAGRAWSRSEEDLRKAADDLADRVFEEWAEAVRDRELTDPIPVRWHWRRRPAAAAEPGPFTPLPGFAAVDADTPDGTIKDLPDVYGGLPTGRVVVLGEAGSGKSDAAAWIVCRVLTIRQRLTDEKRARFPVPILRTVTGWDHHRQSLGDWLAGELESHYAFLRRGAFGRSTAQRLMNSDRVALFLDGFDEMAPESRTAALQQIDRRARYRVVIFSRTGEFDDVRQRHLPEAAELTLAPVGPEDAAAYLRRYRGTRAPQTWKELAEELDERPGGVLARALDSPLMLRLIRDALADPAAVRVLLEGRLTTREQVGYPVLYRPGQSPPDDNQAAAQAQAACRKLMSPRTLPPDQVLTTIRILPGGYHPGTPLLDQVYVDCLAAHR
jgi:NACHT domain-containing protein